MMFTEGNGLDLATFINTACRGGGNGDGFGDGFGNGGNGFLWLLLFLMMGGRWGNGWGGEGGAQGAGAQAVEKAVVASAGESMPAIMKTLYALKCIKNFKYDKSDKRERSVERNKYTRSSHKHDSDPKSY